MDPFYFISFNHLKVFVNIETHPLTKPCTLHFSSTNGSDHHLVRLVADRGVPATLVLGTGDELARRRHHSVAHASLCTINYCSQPRRRGIGSVYYEV